MVLTTTTPISEIRPRTKRYAQANKDRPTAAEQEFWSHVADKHLGVRVKRQHLFGPFIADFWIGNPHRICIEIDGSYHDGRESYDRWRDEYMAGRGVRVVRFSNAMVLQDWPTVEARLRELMAELRPAILKGTARSLRGANLTEEELAAFEERRAMHRVRQGFGVQGAAAP